MPYAVPNLPAGTRLTGSAPSMGMRYVVPYMSASFRIASVSVAHLWMYAASFCGSFMFGSTYATVSWFAILVSISFHGEIAGSTQNWMSCGCRTKPAYCGICFSSGDQSPSVRAPTQPDFCVSRTMLSGVVRSFM
jgi:hypothetical protein